MTWLDTTVVIIILISTIYSFYRGLVKEFFYFAALIGGYLAANRFYQPVETFIEGLISVNIPGWIVYLLIFITAVIICIIIGGGLSKVFKVSITLKLVDRIGGAFIGLFKAALVLSLMMLPLYSFSYTRPILEKSITPPYLLKVFKVLKDVSETGVMAGYKKNIKSIKKRVNKGLDKVKETASEKKEDIISKVKQEDGEIIDSEEEKLNETLKDEEDK